MSTPLVTPDLQSLIASTRDFLNQPDPNNSFWSDVELTRYLNEAVRVHLAELSSVNEGQGATTTTLNIVQAQDTIALPSDFFCARGLFKITTNRNVQLVYQNNMTDYSTQTQGDNSETYIPSYYFRGNSIVLRPAPTFSETGGLLLEYIALPPSMQDSADQLSNQINALFFQSIEMYAVYKAKLKESMVNGVQVHAVALENFSDLFKQFRDLSARRSKRPTSVVPFDT